MFDLLIRSGTVIDGSGGEAYQADIGITNGRIEAIGKIDPAQGKELLSATGLTVSPGFIDCHSHSDVSVYRDPSNWNKLEQGVTTDIAGMCGLTLAPISRFMHALVTLTASETFSHPATARACKDFFSYTNYRKAMDGLSLGTNMAVYVGQHLIRGSVMAMASRQPFGFERAKMRRYLREAMECGALGLSVGLIYPPGAYAGYAELADLCKEITPYGGRIVAHIRSESDRVLESVEEILNLAEAAQIPAVISHHKICGKKNWGKSRQTLERIDAVHRSGRQAWMDAYPYMAGATGLKSVIPPQMHSRGKKHLLVMLKSANGRKEIRQAIVSSGDDWENFYQTAGFDGILIANAPHIPEIRGKTIAEIARERACDPFDVLFDVLVQDQLETNAVYFMMDWDEMKTIMSHPLCTVGTDGSALTGSEGAHPRWVGTFPRFLARMVREEKQLTLPEAIRKITSLAAECAGIPRKGLIQEGYDADLVLFNPDTIQDHADYLNYKAPNTGIHEVLVGGKIAVHNGKYTGINNGKFIWKT